MQEPYRYGVGSLPPKFEQLAGKQNKIQGKLSLVVHDLKWNKNASSQQKTNGQKVVVKFFGQAAEEQFALIPKNSTIPALTSQFLFFAEYKILTTINSFKQYLQDARAIRFLILDWKTDEPVGKTTIGLQEFFIPEVTLDDISPLQPINNYFPIIAMKSENGQSREQGSLQIEIQINFGKDEPFKQQLPLLNSIQELSEQTDDEKSRNPYNELDSFIELERTLQNQNNNAKIFPDKINKNGQLEENKLDQLFKMGQQLQQKWRTVDNSPGKKSLTDGIINETLEEDYNETARPAFNQNNFFEIGNKLRKQGNIRNDPDLERATLELDEATLFSQPPDQIPQNQTVPNNKQSVQLFPQNTPLRTNYQTQTIPQAGMTQLTSQSINPFMQSTQQKQSDYEPMKIFLNEFLCQNSEIYQKLTNQQLFCEITFPQGQPNASTQSQFNQFKISSKTEMKFNFIFSEEIPFKIKANQNVHFNQQQQQQPEIILLRLFVKNVDRIGSLTEVDFGTGSFSMAEFKNSSVGQTQFQIPIYQKQMISSKQTQGKTEISKVMKGKKQYHKSSSSLQEQQNLIGHFRVQINSELQKNMPKQFDQTQQYPITNEKLNPNQQLQQQYQQYQAPFEDKLLLASQIYQQLQMQMLLYIEKAFNFQFSTQQQFNQLYNSIYIAYKIIGSNQKVFTEIKQTQSENLSASNALIDHKMIMPLNGESITKLAKFPFVLEVWCKQKPEDKLLGIIKLNLQQFCTSLFENDAGKLNYLFHQCISRTIIMLQQNKYPTISYDNSVGVQNLQGNQELGEVELIFAIGTPIQINKLDTTRIQEKRDGINKQIQQLQNERSMNQQLTPEKRQPMQQSQQAPFQNQLDSKFNDQKIEMNVEQQTQQQYMTPSELFTFILEKIRRSSNQILPKLKEFILGLEQTGRKLSKTQFMSFLEDLQLPEITKQRTYDLTEIIDYKHNGEIDGAEFMESYNNYYELEELLRNDYISIIKDLKALLVSSRIQLSDFENFLNKETQFGYLRIQKFKQSLQMINFVPALSSLLVDKIVNMMDVNGDGYIFITDLVDYLRKLEVYENLSYIKYPKLTFYNTICKKIFSQLIENQYTIDKLFRNMAIQIPRMGIEHIKNIFYLADVDISIWEALVLIEQINTINKEGMGKGKMEVPFERFEEFCEKNFIEFSKGKNMKQSQLKGSQILNKSQNLQTLKNQKESALTLTESVNDIANLLNQKSSIKNQNQEENEKEIQLVLPPEQKQTQQLNKDQFGQKQLPNQHEAKSSPSSPTKPIPDQELIPEINTFLHEMKRSPSTGKLTLEQKKIQIESDDKFLAENQNQNLTYMLQLQQRESAHKEREAQQFTYIQQQQSKLDEQARIIQQWEQTVADRNERKAKEFTVESCPQIRHAFAIEVNGIEQLFIDEKLEGKVLSLRYLFPKSESLIESSQFVGEGQKSEYQLSMAAKHKFLLDRNIDILQHLINDNKDGLLIQMVKKGEVMDQSLGHCILPWDDFISLCSSVDSQYPQAQKIATTSTKAYFLYPVSNSSKPTLCKLPLTLTYTRKYIPLPQDNPLAQLPIFSSSTTVKRFLPKVSSVFVTVQRVQVDLNYCNEEEFETQCQVSLFNELPQVITDIVKNRNDYYPKHNGHWDFELTEHAIEEFKTQSAVVKLVKNSIHVASGTIKLLPLLVSDRPITCEVELFGLNNSQRMGLVTIILGLQSQGVADDTNVNKFEREAQCGVLLIKLLELFSLDYLQQPRNVYFSLKQGCIGPLIKQESSPSEITVLDGTDFWVNLKELTPKIPLELSLFEKNLTGGQDEMLGYININCESIIDSAKNQNKKMNCSSCYWHLVGTKKQTRTRIGGKVVLWLVVEKNEIPKIERLGHVFGRKDIKLEQLQPIDQYLQHNCKLTCGAVELLEKYLNKLNKQELLELLSAEICSNLTVVGLEDSQLTYDKQKQEFAFYDEKNQGYVDIEVVEKIFKQYGIALEGVQKEVLLKFVCKNLCEQCIDSTIKIFHYEDKFDYQLFLRKLIPEEYFSFSKKKNLDQIYQNSDRINNFYGTKTDHNNNQNNKNAFESAEKRQDTERNFTIEIVIELAKNLHTLNKGLPPNCLVKCENFQNFETQFQIREANPLFNYSNSLILNSKMIQDNLQLNFTIYHRSYNINYQESISSLSPIGRAVINIEELVQRCKQQQPFQQVSQMFTVQIMNKNMEQEQVGSITGRNNPILKVSVQMETCEKNSFIPSQQNFQEIPQQQISQQQQKYLQTPKSKQQQQLSLQQRYSSSDKKYNYNPLQMQIGTAPDQFQPQIQERQQSVDEQFHDELTFDIVENFNKTMKEIYKQTDDQIDNLNQQIKTVQMEKTINELDQIQDKFKRTDPTHPKTLQNENHNMLNYSQHKPKDFDKTANEKKRQNYHQNEDKPPMSSKPSARLSSYKRLRQIEDKLKFSIKDNNELKRIAGIMKQQDLADKQKYFDISSDSDS